MDTTKERPILFSGAMVRAILAGEKTQTRRLVKGEALDWLEGSKFTPEFVAHRGNYLCPYGNAGDRLWVRETFMYFPAEYCYEASVSHPSKPAETLYRADSDPYGDSKRIGWTPSIHMPREHSRITLEITGVRVERLNDISEQDATAEGVPAWANKDDAENGHYIQRPLDEHWCWKCKGQGVHPALGGGMGVIEIDCENCDTQAKLFRNLWESINGAGSWEQNPWVWAISFRRVEQ